MFRTLDDLKKKDPKDTPDKKTVDSYAGGESSGIALHSPDSQDKLAKIIEKAKKEAQSGQSSGTGPKIKLTLYKNGFIIDDGEFRSYDNAENKRFLTEIEEGKIPSELIQKYKTAEIDATLDDKRSEQYKAPPPPSYVAFSGQGVSMAGSLKGGQVNVNAGQKPHVDANKPRTTLTFRLHNGTTHQIEVNTSQSTANIYSYVNSIAPGNFELIAGFPPKPISKTSNVEDSDLCDSRITQKLV